MKCSPKKTEPAIREPREMHAARFHALCVILHRAAGQIGPRASQKYPVMCSASCCFLVTWFAAGQKPAYRRRLVTGIAVL